MQAVMTARGPIAPEDLGMVLMHEHVFINMMMEERSTGLLNDYTLMADEVGAFSRAGGGTLVELTTAELTSGASPDPAGRYGGRPATGHAEGGARAINNVLSLVRLSEEVDVHVVIGTGHYRDPFIDQPWFDRAGTQRLTEQIVRDLVVGFSDTGVKAGIIGEVGADRWYVSAAEERAFRAAGRAQRSTGVAVTTHAARWPVGIDQLDILVSEGADPRRVIIGHCDMVNIPEYHEEIARRGAFVQFDTIRGNTEYDTNNRVNLVVNMAQKGYLSQVLLSHDNCHRTHLHITGGAGYDFVPGQFAAALMRAGLSQGDIEQLLVHNPRRALAGD